MAAKIAGIALAPGVSLNRRLYRPDVIQKAVERAQKRIRDGRMLMSSSHGAWDRDESTSIVGRVVALEVGPDGAAHYRAVLADTRAARDVAALCAEKLVAVSIRGQYVGQVRQENHAGVDVTVPDDLELLGLDFTGAPGVPAASAAAVEHVGTGREIRESVTAHLADPGPLLGRLHELPPRVAEAVRRAHLETAEQVTRERAADTLREARGTAAGWGWKA